MLKEDAGYWSSPLSLSLSLSFSNSLPSIIAQYFDEEKLIINSQYYVDFMCAMLCENR